MSEQANAADVAVAKNADATGEQTVTEVPEAWRQEFKKVISQRDTLKAKASEYEAKVREYEAEKATIEAASNSAREEADNKKLAEEGNYKDLLAKKDKQREAELLAIRSKLSSTVLPIWIRAASSEIENLTPEARKDLPSLLREYIHVDESGVATVINSDKTSKLNDDGTKVDPIKFIKDFVAERKYMILDAMPKSHGGTSGSGSVVSNGAKTIEAMMEVHDKKAMAEWQERAPTEFTNALNEYTISLGKKARSYKK